MSRTIDVVVSPTGETKIESRGFAGSACQQATKELEAALGRKRTETLTSEYHLSAKEEAGIATQSATPG